MRDLWLCVVLNECTGERFLLDIHIGCFVLLPNRNLFFGHKIEFVLNDKLIEVLHSVRLLLFFVLLTTWLGNFFFICDYAGVSITLIRICHSTISNTQNLSFFGLKSLSKIFFQLNEFLVGCFDWSNLNFSTNSTYKCHSMRITLFVYTICKIVILLI